MTVTTEVTDDVTPTGAVDAWWEIASPGVKAGYQEHNNIIGFMSRQLN